jgi:signal transduction histidine kinase/ligand-binding sensor domain-containing protein
MKCLRLLSSLIPSLVLLASCSSAYSLNPSLDVRQYAHTSWKVREGFAKGEITTIAQTPDGYLWVGTDLGLYRFDGIRNVTWQPPDGQQLPSNMIFSLLVAKDGTLWVGTDKGLASWQNNQLTQYPALAGQHIFRLVEDHEGTIWIGAVAVPVGKLCSIQNRKVQCFGEDGSLGRGAFNVFEDRKGGLWVGTERGLWHWRPGPSKLYPMPTEEGFPELIAETEDGNLLISTRSGLKLFVDEKFQSYSLPGITTPFRSQRMLRDRDGGYWFGTLDRGVVHVHEGRTEVFGPSDGLSGQSVAAIFEDRESNIWVTTSGGVDRFRDSVASLIDSKQGLANALVSSILAKRDGSILLSTFGGLHTFTNGQAKIFGSRDGKVDGMNTQSLFQDDNGRVWFGTGRGFGYLENDRFKSVGSFAGGTCLSIDEDKSGTLWIINEQLGLLRVGQGNKLEQMPWASLGHQDHASVLLRDPSRNGIWLGFFLGGLAYFADGQVRSSYTTNDGLTQGRVSHLRFDENGTLWASTEGGLSLLKNDQITTLNSKNGLPCDAIHWTIEGDDNSVWMYTACGLIRIARAEIDGWSAAVAKDKDTKWTIRFTLFDSSDGVRILSTPGHYNPQVAKTPDGKIWFLPMDGISVIDPRHLAFNNVPPPVYIEGVTADHLSHDANSTSEQPMRLPALIRDLQINYTALSLVAPEKVQFRYRLENHDRDWQQVGNRRQAFYNNLPPGNYRFRVIASNNSGVWNETGAFLDFSIAPAYYQTLSFRVGLVAGFALLLTAIYQLRMRQVAGQVRARMEERLNERERIARDLHDTLLQSVQGLILKFHAVAKKIPLDVPAREAMEKTLDHADEVLAEGRDRVRNLRAVTIPIGGLPAAFERLAEEITVNGNITFRTVIEGSVIELHAIVREESYCIGREAIVNAFTHSDAVHVEVEITYDPKQFRLRVRDDGRGIPPEILERGGRADHYGFQGMRERAEKIGGQLKLWSRSKTGTEIELLVPGSTAYRVPHSRSKSWFRRTTSLDGEQV